MIDGIINNGKAHDAQDKEQKKPSLRDKIKQHTPPQNASPKKEKPKRVEREM